MAGIVVSLRTHHHHTLVLVHRLDHPLAFVDEHRERLFDIDIFAGGAGHDGEQGMPVVGSSHKHSIDVLVFVHLAKIAVALGIGAFQVRQSFLDARLVNIAYRDAVDVRERLLKVIDMLLADQSVPDKADTDAVIGPENPVVLCSRQGGRAQEPSSGGLGRFQCVWHKLFPFGIARAEADGPRPPNDTPQHGREKARMPGASAERSILKFYRGAAHPGILQEQSAPDPAE